LPAGYRRIEEGDAALGRRGVELPRHLSGSGGVVDKHRARAHAAECAIGACRHGAKIIVIADAAEDTLRGKCRSRWRRCAAAAVSADPSLRLRAVAIVDGHVVAPLGEQMPRHGKAHHAQADPRDLRHCSSP